MYLRSVNMLTVEWTRGVISTVVKCAACLALSWPAVARAEGEKAELATFASDSGQTFFALSVMPPAAAEKSQPRDVVFLFDTSATQTGIFRETALAALEGSIAKLGPNDRVQIFAVDLEARPMSKTFLAANQRRVEIGARGAAKRIALGFDRY